MGNGGEMEKKLNEEGEGMSEEVKGGLCGAFEIE